MRRMSAYCSSMLKFVCVATFFVSLTDVTQLRATPQLVRTRRAVGNPTPHAQCRSTTTLVSRSLPWCIRPRPLCSGRSSCESGCGRPSACTSTCTRSGARSTSSSTCSPRQRCMLRYIHITRLACTSTAPASRGSAGKHQRRSIGVYWGHGRFSGGPGTSMKPYLGLKSDLYQRCVCLLNGVEFVY